MIRYLKTGQAAEVTAEKHAEVRRTVEAILENIARNGERAVREYSLKFDNWSPESFRLSDKQIRECLDQVPDSVKRDIEFAQTQIRNFALIQRSALRDIEVQTLPGVVLGHKNVPVNSVGCYIPGGRYPMVASAHMSVVTAKAAGVKRVISTAPPFGGKPHPVIVTAMSNNATSTCWPRPSRSRANSASKMALQADIPVAMSTIGDPVRTGGPSGKPFSDMKPLSACVIGSKPGRDANGPLRP